MAATPQRSQGQDQPQPLRRGAAALSPRATALLARTASGWGHIALRPSRSEARRPASCVLQPLAHIVRTMALVHRLPLLARTLPEVCDQLGDLGGTDHQLPRRPEAGVAECVHRAGGDEHGGAGGRGAPLTAEKELDLALEDIEHLVEILMPVRDLKPAARRKLALDHADLA